jgi:hypothetical protein
MLKAVAAILVQGWKMIKKNAVNRMLGEDSGSESFSRPSD